MLPSRRTLVDMIDPELESLALEQSGLFRRSDAERLGVTDFDLRRMRQAGLCRSVIRSVYGLGPQPEFPSDRLLEKTRAMLLANPNVAAAGRSALVVHDIDTFGVRYERAQGVWLNHCATRATTDLIIRRPLVPPDIVEVEGRPVVSPAWAVVDAARDAGVIPGVVAADCALRRHLTSMDELSDVVGRLRHAARIGRAVATVRLADGRSESVGETRLRLLLTAADLQVEPQFKVIVKGEVLARSDLRVKGTRLLLEFDGMVKYQGQDGPLVLAREKRREDRVRPHGWTFERVVNDDFLRPRVLVARIRSAAAAAAA